MRVIWFLINLVLSISVCSIPIIVVGLFDKEKYYTGKLIKTFGKNGTIKIGVSPIPPVIYKDNLIIIDTQSRMKVFDLFSGKIKWKYKINKDNPSILFENFFNNSFAWCS